MSAGPNVLVSTLLYAGGRFLDVSWQTILRLFTKAMDAEENSGESHRPRAPVDVLPLVPAEMIGQGRGDVGLERKAGNSLKRRSFAGKRQSF